jgi:hypothetical protein
MLDEELQRQSGAAILPQLIVSMPASVNAAPDWLGAMT